MEERVCVKSAFVFFFSARQLWWRGVMLGLNSGSACFWLSRVP